MYSSNKYSSSFIMCHYECEMWGPNGSHIGIIRGNQTKNAGGGIAIPLVPPVKPPTAGL